VRATFVGQSEAIMTIDAHFGVSIRSRHGIPVVRVFGELDLAAAPALGSALATAAKSRPADVIVDLSWVSRLTPAGLRVLSSSCRRLSKRGSQVRVVADDVVVTSVLELTGFDRAVTVVDTIAEALEIPEAVVA